MEPQFRGMVGKMFGSFLSIKISIWKLAHGKIPKGADLNVGPHSLCNFYGLESETATHLLYNCNKIQFCQTKLLSTLGLDPNFLICIRSREWLIVQIRPWTGDTFAKALIATTAYLLSKERCNFVFKHWNPKFGIILAKVWSHCSNYFKSIRVTNREYLQPTFSSPIITINTDASWVAPLDHCGLGFIITLNIKFILLARYMGSQLKSPIQAKLVAIILTLYHCLTNNWKPDKVFCDCLGVIQMAKDFDPCVSCRCEDHLKALQQLLKLFPNTTLEYIN